PLAGRQAVVVAERGDGGALDQLHHEVRPAGGGGSRVEDLGDVGVVHQGEACRSASKRAITCLLSMPGLITFRATRRQTGSVCSAIRTAPRPPSPIFCTS